MNPIHRTWCGLSTGLVMLLLPLSAIAGGSTIGNGGSALICNRSGSVTREVFDYAEARILAPDLKIDLGDDFLSVDEKINLVLSRLEKLSPDRSRKYRETIDTILRGNPFVDSDLAPVNDAANAVVPKDCRLQQLAIHLREENNPYHRDWLIDRQLYNSLSRDSQAGLLLHEAIYNELSTLGATDSRNVRYFNSVISSDTLESMPLSKFVSMIASFGMEEFEYSGVPIALFRNVNGRKEYTWPTFGNHGLLFGIPRVDTYVLINNTAVPTKNGYVIEFYDGGGIRSVYLDTSVTLQTSKRTPAVRIAPYAVLDRKGNVIGGCVDNDDRVALPVAEGGEGTVSRGDFILTNDEGFVTYRADRNTSLPALECRLQ